MENILINPKNYKDNYINYLNKCFTNWGNDRTYNWVFNRTVGDRTSDIIIIKNEENEVIGGSGISYRTLKSENDNTIDIGIMTGSWTLPKARGKGCFSKMIEVSKNICNQKGVPFLTAFVMESNPSYRRLRDAGSCLIPTYHFFSKEIFYFDTINISILKCSQEINNEIFLKFKKSQKDYVNFIYTFEEFFQQYINRIKNIDILKVGNDYAIIEETESIIKVLFLTYDDMSSFEINIKTIANWGLQNKSKKIGIFSTKKDVVETLDNLKFEKSPSYFTVLSTSKSVDINNLFNLTSFNWGDKI
jgi:hypothetical protein